MKNFFKTILFICLTIAMLSALDRVLIPKWLSPNTYSTAKGFYATPENSLEVLILGGSVSSYGLSPMELYEEYGISAYNLSSSRQPLLVSYAWLREAYKRQSKSLKLVVLESALLCNTSSVNEGHYTRGLAYLKLSKVKFEAYMDHFGKNLGLLQALSVMFNYHTRWKSLTIDDFTQDTPALLSYMRGWNNYYERYLDRTSYNKLAIVTGEYLPGQETYPVDEESLYYYNKILSFCKAHNIQIMLAKMPSNTSETIWSSAKHDAVAALARESGIDYIDYNFSPLYDELNFNSVLDGRDSGHANAWGAAKITAHLGKYLTEHFDLKDVREDPAYAFMKKDLADYHVNVTALKDFYIITDPADFLSKVLSENAYTALIVAQGDAASGLTGFQRYAFRTMGFSQLASLSGTRPYVGVVDKGQITEMTAEAFAPEGLSFSGVASDGSAYTLLSTESASSIAIKGKTYTASANGLLILLYSPKYGIVLSNDSFPTGSAPERGRRDYDVELKEARMSGLPLSDYSSGLKKYALYDRRKTSAQVLNRLKNSAFIDVLRTFKALDHTRIVLVAGGGRFGALDEDTRRLLTYMGLVNLSECENGDAYVGIIENGDILSDIRDTSGDIFTLERLNYRLSSGPLPAGSALTQTIVDSDYLVSKKGIYVFIYDEFLEKVIYNNVFQG